MPVTDRTRTSTGLSLPAPDPVAVAAAKAALRRRVRTERRARSPQEQRELGTALAEVVLQVPRVRMAATLACYASRPGEPDTTALRAALAEAGVTVLLPVLRGDGDLDWFRDDGGPDSGGPDSGSPDSGGLLSPSAVLDAQVVLVPALAVDTLGGRLGQGGGSYDRVLARVAATVPVMALVHDGELLDAAVEPVPVLAHDRPVDAVATPSRYLQLRG